MVTKFILNSTAKNRRLHLCGTGVGISNCSVILIHSSIRGISNIPKKSESEKKSFSSKFHLWIKQSFLYPYALVLHKWAIRVKSFLKKSFPVIQAPENISVSENADSINILIQESRVLNASSFEWIHLCVSVVPGLLFVYIVYLVFLIAINEQNKQITLFDLTLLLCIRVKYLLLVLLFLEIINPVNWDRQLFLYGDMFISNSGISLCVCILLFYYYLGFLLLAINIKRDKIANPYYPIILLFLLFFLLIMLYSYNFLILFIGIEGVTLCSNILLGFGFFSQKKFHFLTNLKTLKSFSFNFILTKYTKLTQFLNLNTIINKKAISASLLYFVSNIIVTICLGFSFIFLLISYGTLSFAFLGGLMDLAQENLPLTIKLIFFFLIVIFAFKLGGVPFHFWLPGVFSATNYITLFFLAIPVKLVFLFLLFRIFYGLFFHFHFFWSTFFLLIGLFSIIIGSIGLFLQNDIKKFFAYSTINHFGYILIAFSCGNLMGQKAFFIYLFTYLLTNVAFLFFVNSLINTKTNQPITSFTEINSQCFANALPQVSFGIVLLSLLGMPPFLGFWGKALVIAAVVELSTSLGFFISICIILTSVIAAVSYLTIFKNLFIITLNNMALSRIALFDLSTTTCLVVISFILAFSTIFFLLSPLSFLFLNHILEFLIYSLSYPAYWSFSTLITDQLLICTSC